MDASKPTSEPLDDVVHEAAPAAGHGDARRDTTSRSRSAGPGPTTTSPTSCARCRRSRRRSTTASPAGVTALQESVPITAFFGPYSPDLEGTLREFGQTTAYYDANGHYARISPVFPDFALGSEQHAHAGAASRSAGSR